jgi:hypothetical protein
VLESVRQIGHLQPQLPAGAVLLIALAAAAAVLPGVWLVTRHVTVMAHEGAHAMVGSAIGRRVAGIRLKANAEGATDLSGGSAVGMTVAAVVGYLGPSGFGVGAAELIRSGHIVAVLWAGLAALVLLMIPLRASFGVVSVAVAFILLALLAFAGTATTQIVTAYGLTWFLLMSSVRIVLLRGTGAGDATILRGLTRIPAGFWYRLWLLGTVAALCFGAILMF